MSPDPVQNIASRAGRSDEIKNRDADTQRTAESGAQGTLRILFLTRALTRGGAERQLVALAIGLHRRGWQVAVACFYAGGPFTADLEEAGVRVIDLRKHGRRDIVGFTVRLIRALRAYAPDVVYGYMHISNMLALLARLSGARTRVVWGVRSSDMDWRCYNWLMRPTFWLSSMLARYADCIIANSQAGADYHVAHGYPRERIVVIPNGIDTERFRFDSEGRNRLRAEWGVAATEVLIGVVARLDPMKGHLTFLQTAALLATRESCWRFVCIGDGPAEYSAKLRAEAVKLGLQQRLIWAGARGDMPAAYSALDIVCSSSWSEGFPNVVAEAMACERSCVVTDVGGSASIVADCGAIVPPRNPEALANQIEWLWEGAHDALGQSARGSAARRRVLQNFSVEHLVENSSQTLLRVSSGRLSGASRQFDP